MVLAKSKDAPALFPAGLVGLYVTNDFDEMAAIPPLWEQEYQQLGHGQFQGKLFMAHTAQVEVGTCFWSPGVMIRGSLPPGSAMLTIPLVRSGASALRGMEITDHSLLVLYHGEEVDFRATRPSEFFVLVVERSRLEEHARVVLGRPLEALRKNQELILDDAEHARAQLSATLASLKLRLLDDASPLTRSASARALELDLLDQILSRVRAPEIHINRSFRRALAWKAEEYLRAHVQSPITIYDLCEAVAAAQRTLHLAFHEEFGTTPKAYLKMLRLNAVRRDLLHASGGTTVTDIATRWDFLHFGWFAHDYAKMFGTPPSDTLQHAH